MLTGASRAVVAVLLVHTASGCGRARPAGAAAHATVIAEPHDESFSLVDRGPNYPDVLEAVLRRFFEHDSAAQHRNVDYYFIADHVAKDLPETFVTRFAGQKPAVVWATSASIRYETVAHRQLGGTGLYFLIDSFAWMDTETAEVGCTYIERMPLEANRTPDLRYRVRQCGKKWGVTKVSIEMGCSDVAHR